MDLLEVARLDPHAATELGRRRHRPDRAHEAGEAALGLLDDGLMIDRAGGGDDHGGRAIMAGEIRAQPLAVERTHGGAGAEDRAADRLVREGRRLQIFEHQIVGSVLDRADLLDDDVLLARHLVGIECGFGEDVGQHIERERHVRLHGAGVIGGHLDAGRSVELAADRLDLLGDLPGRAPLGALECHVLEEMRNAVLLGLLVATAAADPHAERRGFEMRHRVGDDDKAGRKAGDLDTHAAAPSRAARLTSRTKRSTAAWSGGSTVTRSARRPRSASRSGNGGRTPQAASTASGNLAACAVDSTTIGTAGSRLSFSATAIATPVCGSIVTPASCSVVRIAAAVSASLARPAVNKARIAASAPGATEKRRDWASEAMAARTGFGSRPCASNSRRSKLEETWMSIDGE